MKIIQLWESSMLQCPITGLCRKIIRLSEVAYRHTSHAPLWMWLRSHVRVVKKPRSWRRRVLVARVLPWSPNRFVKVQDTTWQRNQHIAIIYYIYNMLYWNIWFNSSTLWGLWTFWCLTPRCLDLLSIRVRFWNTRPCPPFQMLRTKISTAFHQPHGSQFLRFRCFRCFRACF